MLVLGGEWPYVSLSQLSFYLTSDSLNKNYPIFLRQIASQLSNKNLTINKWQHLAFTQQTTTVKNYLDGNIIGQSDSIPLFSSAVYKNNSIGSYLFSWNCPIALFDDIMIFNKSLTQSEIIKAMNIYF